MKVEEKPVKVEEPVENSIIESANYLTEILDVNFNDSFEYAKKNPTFEKEALVEKYINEKLA